ncbi:MAG: DMT family transporter [Deltaproteobacteria bacterium]
MSERETSSGLWMVGSAAILWGLWPLFLRPAGLPGMTSGAIIALAMALSGLPVQWRGRKRRHSGRAWALMGLCGLLDAGNMGLYFSALGHGSVAAAVLSHYLAPTLAPFFARALLGERLSGRVLPAAALGLVGLALLLGPSRGGPGVLTAALLGGGSAVFYAALFPVGKLLTREFSPLEVQSYHAYVTSALLFFLAPSVPVGARSLGLVVAGALLCAVFAGALFYEGLGRVSAGHAAVLTYLEPLTATSVGSLRFGEPLARTGLLGAALVVGSGAFVALGRSKTAAERAPARTPC